LEVIVRKTLIFGLSLLLTAATGATERPVSDTPQEQPIDVLELDLTTIEVDSEAARELLGSDTIRVRNKRNLFVPRGELPVPRVKPLTDARIRERLVELLQGFGMDSRKLGELNNAYVVQLDQAVCWIHRASGGYKLTFTKNSMAAPTRVKHFREAVQRSLDLVAIHRLLTLTDREEVDIVTVAAVRNALTKVETAEQPVEEFISDYYVTFGRRFNGVPVVNSSLVVRIDGAGELAMVKRNWRDIGEISQQPVKITDRSIPELILQHPTTRNRYGSVKIGPEEVRVLELRCGFLEAPVDVAQEIFRPGCLVSFSVGESGSDIADQLMLALEEGQNADELLGMQSSVTSGK